MEAADAVDHSFEILGNFEINLNFIGREVVETYNSLDGSIFAVNSLNSKNVITEVESLKTTLLIQENDNCATSPVKSFAEKFPGKFLKLKFEIFKVTKLTRQCIPSQRQECSKQTATPTTTDETRNIRRCA